MKHLLMALFGSLNILTLACVQAQPTTPPVVTGETIAMPQAPAAPASNAAAPATPAAQAAGATSAPNPTTTEGQPVAEGQAAAEAVPEETLGIKVAVILPKKGSRFDAVTQYALDGLLAANYASEKPAEILLIRPSAGGSVAEELTEAAKAGAMVAIGPLAREEVEHVSSLPYLPLPVITLNQVDLNMEVPLTPEEIEARRIKIEAQRMADEAAKELNKPDAPADAAGEPTSDAASGTVASTDATEAANAPVSPDEKAAQDALTEPASRATIAADTKVPGLVLAKDIPESDFRYEPRVFPRGLLMMGLSMIQDASYVADLGLKALPRLTEAGDRPKTLILEEDRPLEKRIASSFQKVLIERGFAADRLTINLKDFKKITQFFELVIEDDDPEIDPEDLIDQELDPIGWRQQQLRLRKEEAEKRAMAAFAEPPYYAIFMALDSKTASQIRPRLPLRSRIWSTSAVYPGDPVTNPSARALTYDLKQVGFVDCPFVLNFDATAFEEKYHVPAPAGLLQKRLFALGADALQVALQVARGQSTGSVDGLTGKLSFDLEASPAVERQSQTAMIQNGRIVTMTPDELIGYQVVAPGIHPLLQQPSDAGQEKKAEPTPADTKLTPVTPLIIVNPMAPKP